MSDSVLSIAAIAIALASFVFNVLWNLAGGPQPLSLTNLRRYGSYVKSRPAHWRARRNERRAQREREEARLQEEQANEDTIQEFLAQVHRLREMEKSKNSYYKTEWKHQIKGCTRATVALMQLRGVGISRGSVPIGPMALWDPSGSLVVDWGHARWRRKRLGITVLWHLCSQLQVQDRFETEWRKQAETVLRRTLTDEELQAAGWELFEGWLRD